MNISKIKSDIADADQTRLLIYKAFTWIVLLFAGIFLVAIISLLTVKKHVNDITDNHDKFLITKAIDKHQENILRNLKDYAEWGEAYDHLHKTIDIQWAWKRQNLGQSLYNNFGYEGVFVISPEGNTSYSVLNGKLRLEDLDAWSGKTLKNQLNRRIKENDGRAVAFTILIDSGPAIVAAGWIKTGNDTSVIAKPGMSSLMVFVEKITNPKLMTIGRDSGIGNIHIENFGNNTETAARRELPLHVEGGIVNLVWDSENPGQDVIVYLMPLLIIAFFSTISIMFFLMRNSLQRARLNDEHTFLLDQTRIKLIRSEKRFRDVSETTSDWLWEADSSFKILWLSDRFSAITGFDNNEWIGRRLYELFPSRKITMLEWLNQSDFSEHAQFKNFPYSNSQQLTCYCTLVAKRVVETDELIVIRGAATDVTHEVEANRRLQFLSRHDELTGLPNRHHIKEFLDGQLGKEGAKNISFAMICLDLDKFKPVNDLFGHGTGDALLGEVSCRLRDCIRSGDFVARQGGDEFLILLAGIYKHNQVDEVCQRIVNELNRPFMIHDHEIKIGVSMGISIAPVDSSCANDLLRYADIALYQAKQTGRNRWVYYCVDMSIKLTERRKMESELRTAVRENQFFLVYQPRFNLKNSKVDAVEALIRWQHPERGIIMPDQFITLAEDTGLIVDLSNWVLNKACADVSDKMPGLSVSVNISPVEFQATDLTERINKILLDTGLSAERLEIEVTENVTLIDPEKTCQVMRKLKHMGVKIIIDDFGTGYASLSYLRKFEFDGLKLDKTFIFSINNSAQSRSVIEKIIDLGKAYSLAVTAEGVETVEQLDFLKNNKCDEVQGYLIGHPVLLSDLNLLTLD